MALLEVKDLKVHFPIRGGFFNTIQDYVRAVDGVSFQIEEGKTYGLIGESGSGKTTIGKAIVGLEQPTGGEIRYEGSLVNTTKTSKWCFRTLCQALTLKSESVTLLRSPSETLSGFPEAKN